MAVGALPVVIDVVKVRAMTPRDVRFAAELHRLHLGNGLFPTLGSTFLRSYLRTFLGSPFAVALVAELGGTAVGFLVGTLDEPAHYRRVVRRHGPRLAVIGTMALAVRPAVAWRFARTRTRRYITGLNRLARAPASGASVVSVRSTEAVLSHVAVSPSARGAKAGSALVGEFVDLARGASLPAARLVTRAGDSGAGSFYEKLGWQPTADFVDRDGFSWTRYRLELG